MIYALRNNDELAKKILNAIGSEGQNMRKYYQRRLPSDPSKDYYFIHRETGKTQPVLIEYGFLDSTNDDVSQLKNNLLDYAEAVVRAVADYTSTTYIPPLGKDYYTVKKGDSLYSISNKYNISVSELVAANNLESNILKIGQILKIPSTKEEEILPNDTTIYTVKKGDNLYNIANKYNVSIDEIINQNNLSSINLSIGQQLIIPKNISDNEYIVESGDSLWSIANKYGISTEDLKNANNLSSNILKVGQILKIPSIKQEIEEENNITPENTYTVVKGDSLWSIAKKFDIDVNELKEANNLDNNLLNIGDTLIIPNINENIAYEVVKGDSLWKIANKYGVSVDELIAINDLKDNTLQIGDIIIIPKSN